MGATPRSSTATTLVWDGPLAALAAYEQFRDMQRPRFRFSVVAQLAYLVPSPPHCIRAEPQPVCGEVEISYPTDVWLRAVRHVGMSQAILLEVPLPSSPPSPWDAVWRSAAEAALAFKRGGETGRKGAILPVRQVLDAWRDIEGEKEDLGPGSNPPKSERPARHRSAWTPSAGTSASTPI